MKSWTDTLRGFGHGVERVVTKAIESRDSDEFCPDVPPNQTFAAVHDRHSKFIDRVEREHAAKTAPARASTSRELDVMETQSIVEVGKSGEVGLGEAPSQEAKDSIKTPTVPDVLNGQHAQSPFAHAMQRSNAMFRDIGRSSDERRRSAEACKSEEKRRSLGSHESNDSSGVASSERRDVAMAMPQLNPPLDHAAATSAALAGVVLGVGQRASSLGRAGSDASRPSLDTGRRGTSIEIGAPNPHNLRSAIALGAQPRTESQSLGTLDEIMAGNQQRVIRRRVVLPYQITLLFGIASVCSVGISVGILVVCIRNATWLRGPRAGPQLPEIKDLLLQTLNNTQAIRERLGV